MGSREPVRTVRPETPAPSRGRPRDADVDRRIVEAARQVYTDRGWAGFNFDIVAKTAGASKDAIYRRYESRMQLLIAALYVPTATPRFAPDGTLRDRLVQIARDVLNSWVDPNGLLVFRIFVEAASNPDLLEAYHHQAAFPHVRRMRDTIRQAIADGTLSDIDNSTAFIDALIGGLMMHVLATPPNLREAMLDKSETYLTGYVDLLLRGAGYQPENHADNHTAVTPKT